MFDMTRCKIGDKLVSKHGNILTYIGRTKHPDYPHYVRYQNGGVGSRTNDGYLSVRKPLETDHDIIGFAIEKT